MIRIGLREPLSTFTCLAVSLKEVTDEISHAMCGTPVQTSDSAESAELQLSFFESVRACHLHFLMARENFEDKRAVRFEAIVVVIPVVIGTSWCMTGRALRDRYKLGGSFLTSGLRRGIQVRGRIVIAIFEFRPGRIIGF